MTGDTVRLVLAAFVGASVFAPAAAQAGAWQVERSQDPFTDEQIVTAKVTVDTFPRDSFILVRCTGAEFEVAVSPGNYIEDVDMSPTDVRYRIGKGEVKTTISPIRDDEISISIDQAETMATALQRSEKAAFEIKNHDGKMLQQVFPLDESAEAISQVKSACGM